LERPILVKLSRLWLKPSRLLGEKRAALEPNSNGFQNLSLIVSLPTVAALPVNPTSVPGGSTNSIGTLTLNAPTVANAAQRTVTLSSGDTGASGATSATITAKVTASKTGAAQSAKLTVNP
jgi:hypothetical protein